MRGRGTLLRRRDVLALGASFAGTMLAQPALGQPASARAAVVIGVDRVAGAQLPTLSAAASGATMVGDWLDREGFEVKRFTDGAGPVRFSAVFDAVNELVERGALDQLIIYFAGHGFLNGYQGECWMLSGAPDNPNEAVWLEASAFLARQSGIPNVVFISDACRSVPGSLGISLVGGGPIFPLPPAPNGIRTDVDRFYAALPGAPALELPVAQSAGQFEGIFTACFLDAFRKPDRDMVRELGGGRRVVPNRMLEDYLRREVPKRAQALAIELNQIPDADVNSRDTDYIGTVDASWTPPAALPDEPAVSIRDVIGFELSRATSMEFASASMSAAVVAQITEEAGFAITLTDDLATPAATAFETQTGLVVSGATVAELASSSFLSPEIAGEAETTKIDVGDVDGRSGTVAIRFSDGTGTVVAALPGYIATVVVRDEGVTAVSYVPSRASDRWSAYQSVSADLDRLRATVAAASGQGAFRFEGDRQTRGVLASQFADEIRVLKGFDPTLGLYAAYAYADADAQDQLQSVRGIMRDDLGADLFDVAMLAGTLRDGRPMDDVVPSCPLLNRGWGLLQVTGVRLPPPYEEARVHLRPSLWTTFNEPGIRIVMDALRDGRLG